MLGLAEPPPVTVICAHERYHCGAPATCRPICSIRSKYCHTYALSTVVCHAWLISTHITIWDSLGECCSKLPKVEVGESEGWAKYSAPFGNLYHHQSPQRELSENQTLNQFAPEPSQVAAVLPLGTLPTVNQVQRNIHTCRYACTYGRVQPDPDGRACCQG